MIYSTSESPIVQVRKSASDRDITYGGKQVVIYPSNKLEKNLLTVLDGEGAAQSAVVAPGPIGLDETRLEDFDLIRLQAQHCDLV